MEDLLKGIVEQEESTTWKYGKQESLISTERVSTKKMKYFDINFKNIWDLYAENYISWWKTNYLERNVFTDRKTQISKDASYSPSWYIDLLFQSKHLLNFYTYRQADSKIDMEGKGTKIGQTILIKKNKVGRIALLNFKAYYKTVWIKRVGLVKEYIYGSVEQSRDCRNKSAQMWPFCFWKSAKAVPCRKNCLLNNFCWNNWTSIRKIAKLGVNSHLI